MMSLWHAGAAIHMLQRATVCNISEPQRVQIPEQINFQCLSSRRRSTYSTLLWKAQPLFWSECQTCAQHCRSKLQQNQGGDRKSQGFQTLLAEASEMSMLLVPLVVLVPLGQELKGITRAIQGNHWSRQTNPRRTRRTQRTCTAGHTGHTRPWWQSCK